MILQSVLRDRRATFVAVEPNPPPFNELPWRVSLFEMDTRSADDHECETREAGCAWAEREYNIRPDAWMEAEKPGSAQTLASIVAPLWLRPVPQDELDAVLRLAFSQLPIDERGLTIWPSRNISVISYRAISYGFLREVDALRGPEFESLAALGYDYVDLPAGDSQIDETEVFARVKAEITQAGRISDWLPNEK